MKLNWFYIKNIRIQFLIFFIFSWGTTQEKETFVCFYLSNSHTVIAILTKRENILLSYSTAENKILPSLNLVNSTPYF